SSCVKENVYAGEEWRQMSLSLMLVDETVGEILQASRFTREIVSAVSKKSGSKAPQTPLSQLSNKKADPENTELHDRRKKEKQTKVVSDSPQPLRARSRIDFKVSPPKAAEFQKQNDVKCLKVSTKNRPLFFSTHFSRQQQFCKTKSPVISRNMGAQHKCLMKCPAEKASQFQGKVKNPSTFSISSSLARPATTNLSLSKKSSPKRWFRSFSPSRVAARLLASSPLRSKKTEKKNDGVVNLRKSSSKGSLTSKLCRSFSPSRLATRFVSPLKSRKNAQQSEGILNGVKQRPAATVKFPPPKI
ncbi:microtubule-binding protein TANGLED, partial [Vigna umbellata]|uniref:microtubule-binding protein TANGLED n=1 Tax=Vigna umbellata TaxID=87088 RepID=UPI001F5FD76A